MSGDQNNLDHGGADLEEVMRAAEEAVDKVRSGTHDETSDPNEADFAADITADLAAELEHAQTENAALRDKWLRSVADLDNYKKRVKRDIDDAIHRAVQSLLSSFLPVGDNLDRALGVAPPDTNDQLLKGLDMVRTEFASALGKHGIKAVESVGRPFDPNVHDALQQMDSPEFAPGIVILEYEKGYQRGDKLLRPARVIVAGPGSTGSIGSDAGVASGGQTNN